MGRRPQFDEHDLTLAGLRVVRRSGWSAVSVGSVASELSVTPMALYRVTHDAEDVKRLVADAAAEALQPASIEGPLLDALHAWAIDAYEHLVALPGLASYVIHEWTELPRWLAIVDTFLGIAEADGITGSRAVHTVNAVFSYVLARAQLLQIVTRRRKLQPLKDSPAKYMQIRAHIDEFRTARTDTAFRFGLEAVCSGLQDLQKTSGGVSR